jgi:hypothetical protein
MIKQLYLIMASNIKIIFILMIVCENFILYCKLFLILTNKCKKASNIFEIAIKKYETMPIATK